MALYDYSGVSAVTASAILPFTYWNAFVSFNASSFNASITAHSAIARTASAVAFQHSASTSGAHGLPAAMSPVGGGAPALVIQTATAYISAAGGGGVASAWLVWAVAFSATPVLGLVAVGGGGGTTNTDRQVTLNQLGSANVLFTECHGTAHLLGIGRVA